MQTNIQHFWIRFYPDANWQVVKFWKENGKDYIKGLDWGLAHLRQNFTNQDYELGPEIFPPAS